MAADVQSNAWYRYRPEAVKAVLMAGATAEVQLVNSEFNPTNVRMGAGVNIMNASSTPWKVGDGLQYSAGGVNFLNTYFYRWTGYYESGANGLFDKTEQFIVKHGFTAGKRYRIVLLWSTRSEYALENQKPDRHSLYEATRRARFSPRYPS